MTPPALDFARMAGSSIAAPDAAPWITDFLNAAYLRRDEDDRDVADLRLAFGILTTHWYRKASGRRLHVTDLPAFHSAYGAERFDTTASPRGALNREQLLEGANELLGDWFAAAWADDARRGWGIAFPDAGEREAYDHDRRIGLARLGEMTAEHAPLEQQIWHTYDPVVLPSAERAVAALVQPETWSDYATELGRFTALRPGGLAGQTFEIEVAAGTEPGRPVYLRGYVTITALVTPDEPVARDAWFADLENGLARYGEDEPRAVPEGGEPLVGFDLTTHEGHFMGAGHNRLLIYRHDGQDYVRAAGTWDPMPWAQEHAYRRAGRDAQTAFWGGGDIAQLSMLHQIALATA